MTNEKLKERIRKKIDQNLKDRKKKARTCSMTLPRYDEIYFEGLDFLNKLSKGF